MMLRESSGTRDEIQVGYTRGLQFILIFSPAPWLQFLTIRKGIWALGRWGAKSTKQCLDMLPWYSASSLMPGWGNMCHCHHWPLNLYSPMLLSSNGSQWARPQNSGWVVWFSSSLLGGHRLSKILNEFLKRNFLSHWKKATHLPSLATLLQAPTGSNPSGEHTGGPGLMKIWFMEYYSAIVILSQIQRENLDWAQALQQEPQIKSWE